MDKTESLVPFTRVRCHDSTLGSDTEWFVLGSHAVNCIPMEDYHHLRYKLGATNKHDCVAWIDHEELEVIDTNIVENYREWVAIPIENEEDEDE